MKTIKHLIILGLLASQTVFAQDKALSIDQNGNVGINTETPETTLDVNGSANVNGKINGVRIFQLDAKKPVDTLWGLGYFYSTLTISHATGCGSQGSSAFALYDPSHNEFKIMAQGGSGVGNRVEVDTSEKNKLIFYNDCGLTVTLTFTKSEENIIVTINKPEKLPWSKFSLICQGFTLTE